MYNWRIQVQVIEMYLCLILSSSSNRKWSFIIVIVFMVTWWDSCTIIFCKLFHMDLEKVFFVPTTVHMTCKSCLLVWMWHYRTIIIMQNYQKVLKLSITFCKVCVHSLNCITCNIWWMFSAFPFSFWLIWEYLYFYMSSFSHQKYVSLAIVYD